MMKKFLLVVGLVAIFVVAGCSQSKAEDHTGTEEQGTETKENTDENQAKDEETAKSELLNAQLDLAAEVRPYHKKVVNYETMLVSKEKPSPEDLKQAAAEAQTAAGEAVTLLEDYEVKGELLEEVREKYTNALVSLSGYYTEVQNALEKSSQEADLSKAQEKFNQFQKNLDSIYEKAGLLTPDMKAALK